MWRIEIIHIDLWSPCILPDPSLSMYSSSKVYWSERKTFGWRRISSKVHARVIKSKKVNNYIPSSSLHTTTNLFSNLDLASTSIYTQWNLTIVVLHHTRDRYIDASQHNFENCLLPCFVPQSCLSWPRGANGWPKQLWGFKTWKETIFKIMVGRINVSISSVFFI